MKKVFLREQRKHRGPEMGLKGLCLSLVPSRSALTEQAMYLLELHMEEGKNRLLQTVL